MEKKKSVGGRLKLKGVAISKHSKGSRKTEGKQKREENESYELPEPEAGSGRIVSTGTTIQGFETKFREEVAVGDVIILFHPSLLREEERIVVSILSQRSLTIHEKFSGDIASTTPYKIRKDSLHLERKAAKEMKTSENVPGATKMQDEFSRQLQKKLDKAKTTFTYREKTGMWGYRVVTEEIDKNTATSEDLLNKRVKKVGRDKFCW